MDAKSLAFMPAQKRAPSEFVTLGLGKFQFSVRRGAYEAIKTSYEFNWNSISRLGGTPALQYTGEANSTVTLQAQIATQYGGNDGLTAFSHLLSEARKKEPLELVDAQGFSLGRWVITNLEKEESSFVTDRDAVFPRKILVSLTLRFFGE